MDHDTNARRHLASPIALLLLILQLVGAPAARAADPTPTTTQKAMAKSAAADSAKGVVPADVRENPSLPKLFNRRDLFFWGGTAAALTVAVFNDRWLTDEAIEGENHFQKRLAEAAQPLGNTVYVVPVSLATFGFGRVINNPRLARRAARVGLTVSIATGVANTIKLAFGRERPWESPANSQVFKPFSNHNSFPSGHAATAFAAAVALDRETAGRWVPYVVYPAATAVAWSRVHDNKHWTSDVVAGAAIGGWVSWKTETYLAHRALGVPPQEPKAESKKTSWMLMPRGDGAQLVVVRLLD